MSQYEFAEFICSGKIDTCYSLNEHTSYILVWNLPSNAYLEFHLQSKVFRWTDRIWRTCRLWRCLFTIRTEHDRAEYAAWGQLRWAAHPRCEGRRGISPVLACAPLKEWKRDSHSDRLRHGHCWWQSIYRYAHWSLLIIRRNYQRKKPLAWDRDSLFCLHIFSWKAHDLPIV